MSFGRLLSETRGTLGLVRTVVLALLSAFAAGAAWTAGPPPQFKDCPLTGVMPNYAASEDLHWSNWDSQSMRTAEGKREKDIDVIGAVCIQHYAEKPGKTDGSALEIMENYKEGMKKDGAEIRRDDPHNVVGHLTKDGKEYWINVSASRDDGYRVAVVIVEPFKRSLLPPSGNDYRLLGHIPGFTAAMPTKKNFAEYSFPLAKGPPVSVRGALYIVNYSRPSKPPERVITPMEIIENYRAALHDLNAEFLRDNPDSISARLDDHGQIVWLLVEASTVVAVEEKPFQLSIQPPNADAMKDRLDKEGHIALYVNFDFAKATLKPDAAPTIAQVVELLKRNPGLKVSIDGHTDAIGGHDYNVKLSQDRAASVVDAIRAAGIDGARLKSAGYGPDKPIAPNDTEEGRAKNRRVELVRG
jgi:outer membrane protein OmpA-like peptidoglycan-associated protein